MREMVVSFLPNGTVQHTLKDGFFNPNVTLGGHRSVSRLSEVLFNEEMQQFYIRWLSGPKADYNYGTSTKGIKIRSSLDSIPHYNSHGYLNQLDTRWFNTYEEAVQYEIDEVNRLRLLGHTFD